jgi:hypothetical protein
MGGRLFLVDAAEMSVIDAVAVTDPGPSGNLDFLLELTEGRFVLVYRERGRGTHRSSRIYLLAWQEA